MTLMRCGVVACLLAGCGGDDDGGGGRSDASSASDASTGDAAAPGLDASVAGTVTVTMYSSGLPIVGATVLFHGPDGSLVDRVMTDADGKASKEVLPGSSLTTIRLEGDFGFLATYYGVEPGDEIVTGTPPGVSPEPETMDVTFDDSAGSDFVVHHSCGANSGAASPITATLNTLCDRANEDFLLVLRTDGQPTGFKAMNDVPLVDEGAVVVPDGAFTAMSSFNAMLTGIPGDVTEIFADYGVTSDDGTSFLSSASVVPDAGTEGLVLPYPGGFGATSTLTLFVVSSTGYGTQRRQSSATSAPASGGVNLTDSLLPWIEGEPAFTLATGSVSFTTTGAGSWDLGQCFLQYAQDNWYLYAPPGTTTIALPEFPDDLAGLAPEGGDSVSVACGMIDSDALDADEMRVHAENSTFYLRTLPPPHVFRESGLTTF